MSRALKIFFIFIFALFAAAGVWGALVLTKESEEQSQQLPEQRLELAFEKTGTVTAVYARVGDTVRAGDVLVALNNDDLTAELQKAQAHVDQLQAQLASYRASVAMQEAKRAELKQGARPEEIAVYEARVAHADSVLTGAYKDMANSIHDAFTRSDDAVRNTIDQFFSNPRSSIPQLVFQTSPQMEVELEYQRPVIEDLLTTWKRFLDQLSSDDNLAFYVELSANHLYRIRSFLEQAALAVNGLMPTVAYPDDVVDEWKSEVAVVRASITTAISNLAAAEKAVETAAANKTLTQRELDLKRAPATNQQIAIQKGQIKQAETALVLQHARISEAKAAVQHLQAQLAQTVIRAPVDGVITQQKADIGEVVSAHAIIVSLVPGSQV